MSRPGLLRLATALSLSAGLCTSALAQSERNGRLLPPSASPAITAPPTVAPPTVVPVPPADLAVPAAAAAQPAATAGPTVLPGAAAIAFPPPVAAATPTSGTVPEAPPPAIPAPRALPEAAQPVTATAAAPPTLVVPPEITAPPASPTVARIRVRPPQPAVRAAPTAAITETTDVAVAVEVVAVGPDTPAEADVAEDEPLPPAVADEVAAEVGAPSAPVAAIIGDLEREAVAMRAVAEQERAAVTAPQPQPRPAPRTEQTADAVPGASEPGPVAAEEAGSLGPAVPSATDVVVALEAAVAAVEAAVASDPTAEPHPEAAVAAEPAAADQDPDERRGGVRWIKAPGLPAPGPMGAAALPEGAAPVPEGPRATANPDAPAPGETAEAEPEAAPRVRRRPSTLPIAAPYQLVRTLQAMQDDMAAGSTAALAGQRALLQRMEEEFADADPLVWQDRRNARALVTYTLGGGRPVTLRRLLASDTPPDGDEALMRGALAYVEGDEATARRHLTEIDARSLPASLGGQLALAQAALAVGEDPNGAVLLLDTARLLAPGTLVEEAALRRQIFVASELNDLARFEMLSGQYLRRFRRSVYAGNFRRRFAAALSRMDFLDDPKQFYRLDDMLAETDAEAQRELYLVVAQAAVNAGKTALAATAAERALASAPAGSMDEARGRLYRGAAMAVSRDGLDAAMIDLRRVDKRDLPRTDAALLEAASETALLIQTAAAAAENGPDQPVEATPEDEEPSPTVTRARDAIAAVDTLLEQAL
jgi:chemotaxis protein MotC